MYFSRCCCVIWFWSKNWNVLCIFPALLCNFGWLGLGWRPDHLLLGDPCGAQTGPEEGSRAQDGLAKTAARTGVAKYRPRIFATPGSAWHRAGLASACFYSVSRLQRVCFVTGDAGRGKKSGRTKLPRRLATIFATDPGWHENAGLCPQSPGFRSQVKGGLDGLRAT